MMKVCSAILHGYLTDSIFFKFFSNYVLKLCQLVSVHFAFAIKAFDTKSVRPQSQSGILVFNLCCVVIHSWKTRAYCTLQHFRSL